MNDKKRNVLYIDFKMDNQDLLKKLKFLSVEKGISLRKLSIQAIKKFLKNNPDSKSIKKGGE